MASLQLAQLGFAVGDLVFAHLFPQHNQKHCHWKSGKPLLSAVWWSVSIASLVVRSVTISYRIILNTFLAFLDMRNQVQKELDVGRQKPEASSKVRC